VDPDAAATGVPPDPWQPQGGAPGGVDPDAGATGVPPDPWQPQGNDVGDPFRGGSPGGSEGIIVVDGKTGGGLAEGITDGTSVDDVGFHEVDTPGPDDLAGDVADEVKGDGSV
jgi:hypothetical protein